MRGPTRPVALALAALAAVSRPAFAEQDTFGLGDGADGAQTALTGVINHAAAITADLAAGATAVPLADEVGPGSFGADDLVMLWQPTGLSAEPPPNQAVTSLASERVGTWEFAKVQAVSAGELTLAKGTIRAYSARRAQVVRVPRFADVTVPSGSTVSAIPWNGKRGGIVVFLASGTVTVEGAISASGAGFRGGPGWNNDNDGGCEGDFGRLEDGFAQKGEGVFWELFRPNGQTVTDHMQGRGALANGGGGGDCHNAGGGGGGHASPGGQGGATHDHGRAVGGVGGGALDDVPPARLVFGGGGGAGEFNNDSGTGGGAGGGVVFFRAWALAGAGVVSADGKAAADADDDGGGGGGAGGTVVVRVADSASCARLSATGGKGGNSSNDCGTGGGGAGGRVLLQAGSVGTCPSDASPGAPGTGGRAAAAGTPGSLDPAPEGGYCWAGSPTCTGADFCDVGLGGCVECITQAECLAPDAPFCDAAEHRCRPCTPGDCVAGTVCDQVVDDDAFGQCVECVVKSDCTAPGVCTPDHRCVRCAVDGDCAPPLAVCQESVPACVECRPPDAAGCTSAAKPSCSASLWMCSPCSGDHGTDTDAPCPATEWPICISGTCEQCGQDADCRAHNPLRLCDERSWACVEGCRGTDDRCPAGTRCSSTGPEPGTCALVPGDAGVDGGSSAQDASTVGDGAIGLEDAAAVSPADGGSAVLVYDLGGCGCGNGPGSLPAPWALLSLALLGAHRRRSRATSSRHGFHRRDR